MATALPCATTSRTLPIWKGKTAAASAPGTAHHFGLAWMLNKNGMTMKDITLSSLSPSLRPRPCLRSERCGPATYEPLSVHGPPTPAPVKDLATTIDQYLMVGMDTVVAIPSGSMAANTSAAAAALTPVLLRCHRHDQFRQRKRACRNHGRVAVKQSGEQFGKSAAFLKWIGQGGRYNQESSFASDLLPFREGESAANPRQLEAGVIRSIPERIIRRRGNDASFSTRA